MRRVHNLAGFQTEEDEGGHTELVLSTNTA